MLSLGRIVASGYAKKTAEATGVDLRVVVGTGPNGRIVSDDVAAAAASGLSSYTHVPAAGVIASTPMAKQLAKSKGIDVATIKGELG